MTRIDDGASSVPEPSSRSGLAMLKARQQATWAAGDYAVIGTTLQLTGESLCEAVDLHGGERVLDVAAGNGNATLAAARRFGEVTAADYVPALLERNRARSAAEGYSVRYEIADAEALPFGDADFDVVLSTFGVMFTPDQPQAAAELLRVCRSGGRIGLANWTPAGMIGEILRLAARHVPPPPGTPSPLAWGTRDGLQWLLGAGTARMAVEERDFMFRYRSPAHFVQMFRAWYGPVLKTFAALDARGQAALEAELLALLARFNRATDGTLVAPGRYLEVVATRA